MLKLTNELFKKIEQFALEKKIILENIDDFLYDPKFTPEWLIEHLKNMENDDEIWKDGGVCYQFIFDELQNNSTEMISICSSEDISEDPHNGIYDYLHGVLPSGDHFIFHQPPSRFEIPSVLTIFGLFFTIFMRDDERHIEIFRTVEKDRRIFFHEGYLNRISAIKHYLQNTDKRLIKK